MSYQWNSNVILDIRKNNTELTIAFFLLIWEDYESNVFSIELVYF